MNENRDFFTQERILRESKFRVHKTAFELYDMGTDQDVKNSITALLGNEKYNLQQNEKFQVILRLSFSLLFGWYENGELRFSTSQNVEFTKQDIEEIRVFNETQELCLQRRGKAFWVRVITDEPCQNDGKDVAAVDSSSRLFGSIISVQNGFAELYEPGRKIRLLIPVEDAKEHDTYMIKTRSYITKDNITGQAGYGYYRYVAIQKEGRDN